MAKIVVAEQAKEFYQKLTKRQKVVGGIILAFIFTGLLIIAIVTGQTTDKTVLFSDLEEKDAAKIIEMLQEKNIDYELVDEGKTILIDEENKYDTRMELAKEGLPEDGIAGYELFDQTNLGMSEFVQKLNYRRALEGELTKTIQASDQINKVRVHIVIPEKALFEKDQDKPTASIVLTMSSKSSLGKINIEGIQNLVAASVEGMSPNDVTVVDTRGKMLSSHTDGDNSTASLSAKQHEQTREVEDYYRKKIQSMLDGVLGVGNSEARVTADLNFKQFEKTETKYIDEAVILSQQIIENPAVQTTGGNDSNLAIVMEKSPRNEITNYEVPKTVEKTVNEVGNVERLSVAVAVNGKDTVVEVNGNPDVINIPLSTKEENQLREIVQNALGFDANRNDEIEVYYYPFTPYDKEEIIKNYYQKKWWKTRWWEEPGNIRIVTLGFVIVMALFILFRLMKSKQVQDRVRIALSLPDAVKVEDEDDEQQEEVDEDEIEEIMLEDDDLMLVPAELPDQLLLEGDKEAQDYQEAIDAAEEDEEFDKDSLAERASATLTDDASDMSEESVMKLELKNKVENFVSEQPQEAVKLVRFFFAQDMEKAPFNF